MTAGPVDEGVGPVVATPIMRWLHSVDGPVEQFNQTVVVQAPAGVTEADVVVVLQAVAGSACHAAAARRRRRRRGVVVDRCPRRGRWMRGGCLQAVDVLSDEALVGARSRLNPAAGVMLSALWVASTGQLVLIIHHLAVDGVSWRILLEDLNIAWAQHRGGQPVVLPAAGTSFARWASLLAEHAHRPEVVEQADAWRQVAATPAALPAVQPAVDTYASAGHLSVSLDAETTRMLLGEVPAAFHAGVHDILLIAFGLACGGVFGHRRRADRHRCGGPWAPRGAGRRCGPVAHGGVVHHQIPGGVGRRWAVLGAGGGRRGGAGGGDQGRQRAASRPARSA